MNRSSGNAGPTRGKGRPTEYREEFAEQAAKLCALGATDHELADFFGVDTRTIYRWKNTREDFCQAVTIGKDRADDRVERALYNRAVGYTFESEKVFQHQGKVLRAKTMEHVPPDPSAALNWLKNRRSDGWRDKTEIEVKHSFTDLSDGELDFEIAALAGETRQTAH